jgi:hypothetical protein
MQRSRRAGLALLVVVLACAGVLLIPAVRTPVLQRLGTALVAEDPLATADVILIGSDVFEAGALEAADLVQDGIATRVIVLAGPLDSIDHEIARRGVRYDDRPAQVVRLMRDLGVKHAELLRFSLEGTEAAGRLLPEWCARQNVRSAILVTGADHSRRFRRVLRRTMHGSRVQIVVRASRYSTFASDRWWQQRETLRTGIVELQKLLLDVARHPFS